MTETAPGLWIVAGPNGAGKTTYAFRHIRTVSGTARFINLDEIARGLSPLDPAAEPRRAARVALEMMNAAVTERRSFSLETTLSGRTHLDLVARARRRGFRVTILFFALPSPEVCLTRIARRVAEGGHDVLEADVRRRFARGCANFPAYAGSADLWRVFDNLAGTPKVVAEGREGCRAMSRPDGAGLPSALRAVLDAMPPCPETA